MLSSSLSIVLIGSSLGGPRHFYLPPALFSTAKGVTSSFLLQYGHYCNAESPVQGDPLSDIGPHLFIIIVK